jgi:hypothetical protein
MPCIYPQQASNFVEAEGMVEASRFHLIITNKEWSSSPSSHSHPFTQRPQYSVVFFFLPHIREWLSVLELQVVVFCHPEWHEMLVWGP